jgi:chloride channel protein, CIC family
MSPAPDNAKSARPRLKLFLRWTRRVARSWVERARGGETVFFLFVAAAIGVLGGLGAIAFETAIHLFQDGLWNTVEPGVSFLRNLPAWKIALVPALGGLLVGLITTYFVAEAKGHGVPEVMKAVALRGGLIRGRVALAKTLTSAITIGSGGSAGREGPIIQIGAAIGSRIGQAMGMSKRRLRTLVGCGAAAGIAATFNAPIAGALFAVEVILGEFGAAQFGPIVISSVLATVVARAWRGNAAAFAPPACTFASAWELIPYILLGLLCGLVSFAYIRLNQSIEHIFEHRTRWPAWLRPAIGGLLVGLLALVLPHIMGDGHWLANDAFAGRFPVHLLLLLVAAKILATSLTLGSGGSGGVFSPALSIGALLGAAVGALAAPALGPHFGGIAAYSLVGMAGLVAGSMLAPITAILMVFEITSNYAIILPVMLASILSTVLVARLTGNLSIYTLKLARDGVQLFRGRSPDLLLGRHVADHLRTRTETIRPGAPAQSLMDRMLSSEASQFYVVDAAGALLGAITLADARRVLLSPPSLLDVLRAEDVMRRDIPHVLPADTLSSALAKFASTHLPELPVLESAANRRLAGTLAYADVLAAYQEEILHADAPQALSGGIASLSRHPVSIAPGFEFVEWDPPVAYHGQTLADARLPDTLGVRVLLVKRRTPSGQIDALLPDARTTLAPDDTLVLLGPSAAIARAINL